MKKLLKNAATCASMFLFLIASAKAQTPAENLQNGVEMYNAMREYMTGFNNKTITYDHLSDLKFRMEKGVVIMDKVIREGNADEIKSARYFKSNFKYEYGFALGMKGENAKAFDVMKEIEKDVTALTSDQFPLRYVYFDKNFVINWDNFAQTQAEYYTGFGEIAYNIGKYDEAARLTWIGLAHPNSGVWLKYVAVNKMLDISAKNPASLSETERQDYALQSIKLYDEQPEDSRKTITEYEYPTVKRGVSMLLDHTLKNNVPLAVARCAEAAPLAGKYMLADSKVLQLYEICYRSSHSGSAVFHRTAEEYARTLMSSDRIRAEFVAVAAIERLGRMTAETDCAGFQQIASLYAFWKKTDKVNEFNQKAEDCAKNAETARKKAEKAARRADNNFNLYTGGYIFPLFQSNAKRDYGAVINFSFSKVAWEFSYLKINQNKENIFDLAIRDVDGADQDNLSRWDGYYAHIQPKFYARKREGLYTGLLMGYASKKFESMDVNVVRDADGVPSRAKFEPKVTQYILMANFGGMALMKGFGLDVYWGIGAHYGQFEPGTELDRNAYTIDNPLLENRKDNYFGFIMRFGLTMGLNFGPGNL